MQPHYVAIIVFISSFFLSGLAGISAFLKTGKELKKIAIITAFFNSSLLGLAICLLCYDKFKDSVYTLMGICVMMGLSGSAGLEFVLNAIQKGGFSIKIGEKEVGFDMSKDSKDSKDKEKDKDEPTKPS